MKRLGSILVYIALGLLIAAWLRSGGFGIGARGVQAADSFEVDRQQILDLISRYSYAVDSGDAEALTALFQDNAVESFYLAGKLSRLGSFGSVIRSNKERLVEYRQGHKELTAQGIQSRHYQTNTILERQPDGSVRGNTLFEIVWQYAAEPAPRLLRSGTYRDLFIRTSSGWKFASREIHIDHK